MTPDPLADVDRLLAESRSAHMRYRQALDAFKATDVRDALQTAYDTRIQAERLDPDHKSAAWRQERVTHPHKDLLLFYLAELAKP